MALGQRKRQRLKRQRSRARLGDAALYPPFAGGQGLLLNWLDPSAGMLRTLRRAIRQGWIGPEAFEHFTPGLNRIVSQRDVLEDTARLIAAARVYIQADLANVRMEEIAILNQLRSST